MLAKWNALFEWVPMESVLYESRPQYYQAIEGARKANDSAVFIEFTLSAILDTLKTQEQHQEKHGDKHQVELSDKHFAILRILETRSLARKEIFAVIGMSGDTRSSNRNIAPLLNSDLIEMTVPDKPNSRLQKYRLTAKGKAAIQTRMDETL
jgi:Fic family protein